MVTNCFLRSYFELEHMYSHRMAELPCIWLSADHTFKVSANIGAWSHGVWVKQFDSLFTVLNEKGLALTWRLTRHISFEKVKSTIQNLKKRLDSNGIKVTSIYVDNCCQWRNLLQCFRRGSMHQAKPFSCCSEYSIENTKTWKERFCNKRLSPTP